MSEPPRAAVVLATHEAVANAIQHSAAANPVTVRGESRPEDFLIEITDDGKWKTPDDRPSEERGRGLDLILNRSGKGAGSAVPRVRWSRVS